MALYYDAATVLSSQKNEGSLKSRIYGLSTAKSKPAQIYALISETAKRDDFLKEVIDNSDLLKDEPKLTPLLALLLCHDHFFAKSGIAAPAKHPLRQAIEKRKARIQSEFTRARVRRGCASVDALKSFLEGRQLPSSKPHPRWARVNKLASDSVEQVLHSLPSPIRLRDLSSVLASNDRSLKYCEDAHVPDLLAFAPGADLTKTDAYNDGQIILQDKASCFPACLLLGDHGKADIGDVIDACAAPGNKTTHLAAILSRLGSKSKIFACERDGTRSKTLQSMVNKAGATQVWVMARQDFLALDPHEERFKNVTHLLLDPSCSGSGILRREDVPQFALPNDLRGKAQTGPGTSNGTNAKKRKRNEADGDSESPPTSGIVGEDEEGLIDATNERLQKLSNLQTRIVEHAMKFPAATRITYSTCSIHEQENEVVISRLLTSDVAQERGWQVLSRSQQVEGMRKWKHRGVKAASTGSGENKLNEYELEACIRCYPDDDDEGTMGFFVCAFQRESLPANKPRQNSQSASLTYGQGLEEDGSTEDEESWEGFE